MEEVECKHHWIIATAAGRKSKGICQNCGQEKSFFNWLPMTPFGDSSIMSGKSSREFYEGVRLGQAVIDLVDPFLEVEEVKEGES